MAEPAQEAASPPGEDDTQAPQPALPKEQEGAAPSPAAAAAADPTTLVDTDQELEQALRAALAGPGKDLGLLCKTLGDRFCLEPRRNCREDAQAVCDSGSDTTSPADQEPSSSETDGDSSASGSGGGGGSSSSSSSSSSSTAERESREDDLQAVSAAAKISADLLSSAWSALSAWRETISVGDLLDVFNSMEGEWYLGKVLHTVDEEEEEGEGKPELEAMEVDGEGGEGGAVSAAGGDKETTLFRIHYQGWPNKYDETLSRDSPNLQPVHTHSKRVKKKPDRKKKRAKEVKEWIREDEFGNIVARGIVGEDDPYDPKVFDRKKAEVEGEAEETKPAPVEGATTNRYGRVVVPRVNLATPKGKGKAKDPNGDGGAGGGDDAECNEEEGEGGTADGESAKGKKRTNRKAFAAEGGGAVNSADDWICAMCSQLDTPCMSDMVTCDGPCLRSFHVACLDVGEDALMEEKWLCEDCERGEHECWQCGDYGQDNVVGGVFRCGVPSCGRFYHRHCVELNKNSVVKADVDEGEDGQPIFKFRCAYHTCDTCCSGRGGTKNHLYKCIKCPTAYHLNCIPPDARYHELALICEAHPEAELPALKQEDSILGRKGKGEGEGGEGAGEAAPVKFSLPPLKFPKHPPKAENRSDLRHFRLPMSILTSYHSKPPPFQHICAMQFVAPKPPRVDPTPACNCSEGVCGDSCLNAMLRTECVCGNGIRAKYQNCKLGAGCGNRRLQNRVTAKVAPFREAGMGWGLKVAEDVPKGSLIGEYVGEVIDEAMVEHRMAEQRRLRPNDGEFYIMELGQSLFVDAKEKGNLMRLINHSCNPNCDVQAWNIAGYTRLGIYAKKDLAKGESLSYDYKFSTNEKARFKCMCGAKNCRGTLAPKKQEEEITEDGSKLKGKARKEMLQKRERMAKNRQARSQVGQLVTCKRLSLTGRVLPGDRTAEVKAGPPAKYFGFARDQGIFLVRNARAGADLLTRKRLLATKAEVHARKAALLAPPPPPPQSPSPNASAVGTGGGGGSDASGSNPVAAAADLASSGRRGRSGAAAAAAEKGRGRVSVAAAPSVSAAAAAPVAAGGVEAGEEPSVSNAPPTPEPAAAIPPSRRSPGRRSSAAAAAASPSVTAIESTLPSSPGDTVAAKPRSSGKGGPSNRKGSSTPVGRRARAAGAAAAAVISSCSPGSSTRQRSNGKAGGSPPGSAKKRGGAASAASPGSASKRARASR